MDAEKAAGRIKGSFDKIDMKEARGGMMLFGDLVGVHLPRHVTSFIASLGPVGAAMEAAFPFLAIAVGAVVLIEHLTKLHETAEKLENATAKFDVTTTTTFANLQDRLLQAQIKADELSGNHLGALKKQLELIDHQSMKDLMQTFDNLAKAADAVFAELKSHWYTFGSGGEGAKKSLQDFQNEYDRLLAKAQAGDKQAAADAQALLQRKVAREKQMLADMRTAREYESHAGQAGGTEEKANAYMEARTRLSQAQIGYTEGEVKAEEKLLEVLTDTVQASELRNQIKDQEGANLKTAESQRESGEEFRRMKEEERQQREEDRQREEAYRQAVEHIQEGEKEKVAATKQGTAERLAAIDAATREENNKGLQETVYYKELVRMRIETIRVMAEEEARIRTEAGKIAAEHDIKMADLQAALEMEQIRHRQAMRKRAADQDVADQIETADKESQVKKNAIDREIAALDKNDKDYINKKQALNNKEEELEKAHQNKLTEIKDKAEEQRNARILSAERSFQNSIAQGLSSVLMGHETFAHMMASLGDQVVSGLLKNALMSMMTMDMTKEKDAAHAARKAFNAGMEFPFPINIAMAPVLAAGAFAAVMAFEKGGIIPEDAMALVHKNEMVLPANIASHVMAAAGGGGGSNTTHVNLTPHFHNKYREEEMMRVMDRWAKKNARRNGQRWTN